ncbi:glutamine amidotransferase-like class 1 domain-containing protein 1 [Tubulanus polymorphus]|uniref:glutamine amidotransferase-like class 1 domain-containing protein 1 n=1 Tax=Tubulanus polymorphus TaxID=672921 RepID=UPI003DA28104
MAKANCLFVLSSSIEGVSAPSFRQSYLLAHSSNFNIQLASPQAKSIEYIHQDDECRLWLNDFKSKSFSNPIALSTVDVNRYSALLIPHSPGAVYDLAHNTELANILSHFISEKKPICVIGMGVAALCCAKDPASNDWMFKQYSLTATSVYELAHSHEFSCLPIIPEDFIKDKGARYSSSEPNCVYVVVDRHLVSGQNEKSTLTAVQNLILLHNQRQSKTVK